MLDEYENTFSQIDGRLKAYDKKLDEEHARKIDDINEAHDTMKKLHESRLLNYQKESQHGGVELENKVLMANEDRRKEDLAQEQDRYTKEKAGVQEKLAKLVERSEHWQAERNDLKQQHAMEKEAVERFREESKDSKDVTPQERIGKWVEVLGKAGEKAWNLGCDISMHPELKLTSGIEWKHIGEGVEGIGHALQQTAPESMQHLFLSSKQVDELIVSGVDKKQTQELEAQAVIHSQQLKNSVKELLPQLDHGRDR